MPEFVSDPTLLILAAICGYLLGSIPFGIVIARLFGLGNLRDIGSGNIGATNVLRTGSKPAAAATLVLDSGKGAMATLLALVLIGPDAAQIAALASFVGHCFPVWLGFKGGKGVATFLGILLALHWPIGAAACLTWLVVAAVFRISSLSALIAAATSPVWAFVLGRPEMILLCLLLAALIFVRHGANIRRILTSEEPKIGEN